jgi:hypothetical protein
MMEAIGSSEISVLKRATRRNTTEDGILQDVSCLELLKWPQLFFFGDLH